MEEQSKEFLVHICMHVSIGGNADDPVRFQLADADMNVKWDEMTPEELYELQIRVNTAIAAYEDLAKCNK